MLLREIRGVQTLAHARLMVYKAYRVWLGVHGVEGSQGL